MPALLPDSASFHQAIKSPELSVVHFAADFAVQCVQVNDLLDTLSDHSNYSNVKFYKCQAEDLNDISLSHNIEAVPTVILFQSGKAIDRIDGADASKITEKVNEHSGAPGRLMVDERDLSLEERMERLVNKYPVLLVMKGDRDTPRCGFSRQIVQILNDHSVQYETFDILTDEDIRQGLKVYSNWPTYPQLYVKGELVGGLDIVKDMVASGELLKVLKP